MDSEVIKCKDFGELKILKFIKVGLFKKYFDTVRSSPIIAADNLILDVIVDNIEIQKLTDLDKIDILFYISKKLDIANSLKNKLAEGLNYYEAFYTSMKGNNFYQSKERMFKKIKLNPALDVSILKLDQTMLENQNSFFRMKTDLEKKYGNIDFSLKPFQKILHSYDDLVKRSKFPLTFQCFKSRKIEDKFFRKQTNIFKDLSNITIFNIDRLKFSSETITNFIKPIDVIFEKYCKLNSSFNFINNTLTQYSKNLEYINRAKDINWSDQLDIISKLINSSNIGINHIKDYFSKANPIESVFNKDLKKKSDIVDEIEMSFEKSEMILQDLGGALIGSQNLISQRLDGKIDILLKAKKDQLELSNHLQQFIKPKAFLKILDEFAVNISRECWSQFWEKDFNKFRSAPESIAKTYLGMFLSGMFCNVAFIGSEVKAGNGFVDLIIHYLGKFHIVELKVIGASTPVSWAKNGIKQLEGYMSKYKLDEGYLVVFDGRKTERGKQLNDYYEVSNGRIYVKKIKIYYTK